MQSRIKNGLYSVKTNVQEHDLSNGGVLVVGEVTQWTSKGRSLPDSKSLQCINFDELTIDIIDDLNPTAVFSPLFCSSFDCMDVAVKLQMIGYRGQYRAVGGSLPNPELIGEEIKQTCPNIDFEFVSLDTNQRTH